jgi:uncharacterized protein YqeY
MSLAQKIDQELKTAMQEKDAVKLSTLRFLKSALKYSAIEKKIEFLNDADAQALIQKQIKQRRESIDQFSKNGRPELAAQETAELKILEGYLPSQMSDADLEAFVAGETQAAGATSKKDFGRIMKLLNEKLQGRADSKRVSESLGKILQ